MPSPVLEYPATPTGLDPSEVRALRRSEKLLLDTWHERHAGDDNGKIWLPGAIRRLAPNARLALAGDEHLDADWTEREQRRIQNPRYFIPAYGHVFDEEGAGALPFSFWPRIPEAARKAIGARDQAEVLERMLTEQLLAVLKARQLGLTWMALHVAYHLMAFDPLTPNARVLVLSQDGNYAKRNLERTRRIRDLLPPWARHPEDRETRESKSEFKLEHRGDMISLPGTPTAPRTYQAQLAIADEWAFVRNAQAGPTMTALLSAAKRIIAISSGNGPPDEPGWGQHFAKTWTEANEGTSEWFAVFLPTSTHPDRNAAWRERERGKYDTEEEALAEHPEDPDQGLAGKVEGRIYSLGGIAAAVRLGGELDALLGTPNMPPPAKETIHLGIDWGLEQTAGLTLWPLEGGGIYVAAERVLHDSEPAQATDVFHDMVLEVQDVDDRTGRLQPPLGEARYDAAGAQSMKTFRARAWSKHSRHYQGDTPRIHKVPFGDFKEETMGYTRRLLNRAAAGRTTGIIAISPTAVVLIRQLRGLRWKKGKVDKGDDDAHDALIAGLQRQASRWRDLQGK